MATRASDSRITSRKGYSWAAEYQRGSAARKIEYYENYEDVRRKAVPERRQAVKKSRGLDRLSLRSTVVITMAVFFTLVMCILYLNVRSELNIQSRRVYELNSELSELTEANNTRYNHINDSVSLDQVRDTAINELGMTYADSTRVITYEEPATDYMEQNAEMPR